MGACIPRGELPGLSARRYNQGGAPSSLRVGAAEKERRRVVFRDPCNELGYVLDGHGVALPAEGYPSASGAG